MTHARDAVGQMIECQGSPSGIPWTTGGRLAYIVLCRVVWYNPKPAAAVVHCSLPVDTVIRWLGHLGHTLIIAGVPTIEPSGIGTLKLPYCQVRRQPVPGVVVVPRVCGPNLLDIEYKGGRGGLWG